MKTYKILIISILFTVTTFAQNADTTYSITTEIGVGYSRYFTTMDYNDLNKNGFAGTLRVMWNPEHLLSIGLETGYQYLYSIDITGYTTEFGTTDFSASMYAVPINILLAMKVTPNIKISAASGMYLLFNSGNLYGDAIENSQISIGVHAGVSYTYPINESISLGGELLYSYYSKIQDQTVAIQFLFVYNLLEW
jgi:Outer membrane protein beta-barrel domain